MDPNWEQNNWFTFPAQDNSNNFQQSFSKPPIQDKTKEEIKPAKKRTKKKETDLK